MALCDFLDRLEITAWFSSIRTSLERMVEYKVHLQLVCDPLTIREIPY